jgi:lycopene cyclase domain-containing protein
MLKFGYLAMIAFTVAGSFWLEIFLKVGVLRRIKRVLLSILPVATLFIIWDLYAISRGHWHFDSEQILGIFGFGGIPLEEFLFFTVVPLAAIMTIEAVGVVKRKNSKWKFGDER